MKKYPVISESGNEYEVKVFFGESIAYAGLNVIIYEKRKALFNRSRNVTLRHYSKLVGERETLEKYSYVELIKEYVRLYENEYKEEIAYINRLAKVEKEFEEWDGIVEKETII